MKKILFTIFVCSMWVFLSGCWWNKDETDKSNESLNTINNVAENVENEVLSYSVKTSPRSSMPGEDIYIYDSSDNLVLSLNDENQPQYLFALYENFVILDSWTSASQRDMLVYDIKSGNKIFRTDYFPWENGLVLNDNEITFYKKIDNSLLWEYILPKCENVNDNGYIENYGYTIWEDQANDLGDIQCAYFE